MSWVDAFVYLGATSPAWIVMMRVPQLPSRRTSREPVSIVIPARNEEHQIANTVQSALAQMTDSDEILVVDDDSSDGTAEIARAAGARVISAGEVPEGWRGKPHACCVGAEAATSNTLIFLDADVGLLGDALSRLCAVLDADREMLVSVQPRHKPVRAEEHLAMLFNVVSVLASGAGLKRKDALVFGPVIACDAERYRSLGGHGSGAVRNHVNEDVALGRLFSKTSVFVGSSDTFVFRMYPRGLRSLFRGFTKNFATGALSAPAPSLMVAVAWVSAQVGVLFTSPMLVAIAVLQMWWMAHRVGKFGVLSAVTYPLHLLVFLAVLARSAMLRVGLGSVDWAGRRLG